VIERGDVRRDLIGGRCSRQHDIRPWLRERRGHGEHRDVQATGRRGGTRRRRLRAGMPPGQPSVGQRFLDDDTEAGVMSLPERRRGRSLQQIPRGLHRLEDARPVHAHVDRPPDGLRLSRSGHGEPDRQPFGLERGEPFEHRAIVEDAALERRRVNLIELQVRREDVSALGHLPLERAGREVLHLVHGRVGLPVCGVPVSPFRTDGRGAGWHAPRAQPRSKKGLGQPVRSGRVDVADAGRPGRVEHGVAASLHGVHGPVAAQIGPPSDVDVRGPAQCGKAQAQSGDVQARGAQVARTHRVMQRKRFGGF
jgi:hypothetical protein